jgi:hypothetical protein
MSANHVLRLGLAIGCTATAVALVIACSSKSNNGSGGDGGGGSSGGSSGASGFSPGSTEYTAPDGEVSALESPGTCSGTTGGSVLGPQDDHCVGPDGGQMIQVTTAEGCTDMGDGGDAGLGPDVGDPCPGDMNAYGAVMYNNWGSDDDCKYDVAWQSTPICENEPVYFTVVVTKREDNSPLLGVETGGTFVPANPRPDVVLSCSHPIPNTPKPRDPSPSVAPGTYVVGPIVFDQPGDWVFRFHFNEECLDIASDSPHGHAAFHIQVP